MSDAIQYAIIGFGGIAENRIAKEGFACDSRRFAPLKCAQLIGATDVNSTRRAAVEGMGLRWYDSAETVLADPKVQAVFIATNNRTHAPIADAALRAGKHAIVEKPLATTVYDAQALVDLAAEKNLSLSVDHMMVHNAWNRKARQLVSAGTLGTVNDSCFHMEFAYGFDPAEAATWRCADVAEMGGPIGDVASHAFYMAEFIFGQPIAKLACSYYPKFMNIRAEDGAYIKFWLADGTAGSIRAAFSEMRGGLGGTLSNLGYEIYGSQAALRGYATLFQLSGHPGEPVQIRLELDRFTSTETIAPGPIQNIYQCVIEHHAESIQSGKPINAEDAVHNLRLCAAAHQSARQSGTIVEVG